MFLLGPSSPDFGNLIMAQIKCNAALSSAQGPQ